MKIICLLCVIVFLNAQSSLNPNISLIGDMRIKYEKITPGKDLDFTFPGMELVIENYLNPYSKAWVTIHFSDDEKIDIEEAYITLIKGLPLNSQIRFGRYFLPFGEIMQKHQHIYAFMDYPMMHKSYFGDEGTRNIGLEVNFAFPVFNQFSEFKLNILEGNISPEGHDHAHEDTHVDEDGEEELIPGLAFGVYYSIFSEITDNSNLKSSFSYLKGGLDQEYEQEINLMALAFKYKWQPSDYKYFEILTEIFFNDREVEEHDEESLALLAPHAHEHISNSGYFLSANYQFDRFYNFGFSYASYDNPVERHDPKLEDFSAFFGYAPFEESLLFRLKYGRDITNESNKVELQAVFSLGPHKAHQF